MAFKSRLVAIVDDEVDITMLFRDTLSKISNIRTFTFTDSELAFEHFTINKSAYAMVISDLRMPGLDGMQLIKKIKDVNPFARTILMTAFEIGDNLFQEYTKKQIINGFLQKPIRLSDLITEVNNQLHYYELQKQKSLIAVK